MNSEFSVSPLKGRKPKQGLVSDYLAWILIGLSSLLLGIWALKGTIALRNVLLGMESVISLYCIFQFYKIIRTNRQKIAWKNYLPLVLLGLMFSWVVIHFLFFTRYPETQFSELVSTWFRAILAAIVGAGTGLSILVVSRKRPYTLMCLWLGIFLSFCFILFQYLAKAIQVNNIYAIDYGGYIIYGKISGVLIGVILIAGIIGNITDLYIRTPKTINFPTIFFSLICCLLPVYVFVFVLDTRNGIALALFSVMQANLILILNLIRTSVSASSESQSRQRQLNSNGPKMAEAVVVMASIVILFAMISAHISYNAGWYSMFEDAKIGMQIERFTQWQNPQTYGYPQNSDGRFVIANTYERFAWATAGLTIFLPENPLGIGVLKEPFRILLLEKYPNAGAYIPSTHSAWVEIGLSYGYLGIIFLMGSLLSLIWLTVKKPNIRFRYSAMQLSSMLLLLFLVGEVSSQHSIEMLCFFIVMLTFILLPKNDSISIGYVK